jgi:flagellar protein FlbD
MIRLTRLDGQELVVNAELIEYIHAGPDTLIALTTDRKIMVRESPEEVIRLTLEFKARAARSLMVPMLVEPA